MDIDLIYTDVNQVERGYLNDVSIDMTFDKANSDGNDFELSIDTTNYDASFAKGSIFYSEETEVGGLIGQLSSDTGNEKIVLSGLTWRGLLETIYIQPADGEAYYVASGEANTIISNLINGQFDGLFVVDDIGHSEIVVNYSIRDISILQAIEKALYYATPSAKLEIKYYDGKVHLKAVEIQDLSDLVQYDETYGVTMIATTSDYYYTHILALGSGELEERLRINLYMTKTGEWSNDASQNYYVGLKKRTYKYDASSVEDADELTSSAIEVVDEANSSDTIAIAFDSDSEALFDYVAAKEEITGIECKEQITSKILKGTITDGKAEIEITYKVGE